MGASGRSGRAWESARQAHPRVESGCNVTARGRAPQSTSLSVSGLPVGVTASFGKNPINSGESTQLVISAVLTAMTGAFQFYALKKELVDTGKMTYKQYHDAVLHENAMPVEMVRAILTNQPLTRDYKTQWKFYKVSTLEKK